MISMLSSCGRSLVQANSRIKPKTKQMVFCCLTPNEQLFSYIYISMRWCQLCTRSIARWYTWHSTDTIARWYTWHSTCTHYYPDFKLISLCSYSLMPFITKGLNLIWSKIHFTIIFFTDITIYILCRYWKWNNSFKFGKKIGENLYLWIINGYVHTIVDLFRENGFLSAISHRRQNPRCKMQ